MGIGFAAFLGKYILYCGNHYRFLMHREYLLLNTPVKIKNSVFCLSEVTCWMVTGVRQAARIRGLYLKTMLRQDVAFFDKEINTGEVVGRMSGDTILIEDAMGEKVLYSFKHFIKTMKSHTKFC